MGFSDYFPECQKVMQVVRLGKAVGKAIGTVADLEGKTAAVDVSCWMHNASAAFLVATAARLSTNTPCTISRHFAIDWTCGLRAVLNIVDMWARFAAIRWLGNNRAMALATAVFTARD